MQAMSVRLVRLASLWLGSSTLIFGAAFRPFAKRRSGIGSSCTIDETPQECLRAATDVRRQWLSLHKHLLERSKLVPKGGIWLPTFSRFDGRVLTRLLHVI